MFQDHQPIKFYVIVPVYKAETYIHNCIESVLNQTYRKNELILVDDGSPDRSGEICDQYKARYKSIHVIHKNNEGQLSARQAGIDFVRNKLRDEESFFVFLDSDDTLERNALAIIADTVSQQKCDVVVYGIQCVSPSKEISAFEKDTFVGAITDKRQLYKRVFGNYAYNSLCRKAIKCDLMQCVDYSNFFSIRFGEDLLQSIPVYRDCSKVVFIPDALYNYTINENSVTHGDSYKTYLANSVARAEVWQFLQSEKCFAEEDEIEYLEYCRKLLKKAVLQIACLRMENHEKIELLQQMRSNDYHTILLKTRCTGLPLRWLKEGKYMKIIAYAKLKCALRSVYRRIRALLLN